MSELEKINDFHVACCECDDGYVSRPCDDARSHAREHFKAGVAEERARILKLLRVDWHRYGNPEDFIEQNSPGASGKEDK